MNKHNLRERYERFKQWQEHPHDYKLLSDKVQHCNNCGSDFTGNFCPICSQKAGMGRVGWLSVHQGVMDIWGLGTRSLLYSIWQLLWRPGHFIRDYISGKRQLSFPPVKMLFIVAVIYSFLFYWLFPDIFHIQVESFDKESNRLFPFMVWYREHFSWATLMTSMLLILPTWILFRYAPRYPLHSIPEGFFIQVLMAVLQMVLDTFSNFISGMNDDISSPLSTILYGLYSLVAYRQLFGYSIWGTIWRMMFMWASFALLLSGALFLSGGILLDLDVVDSSPAVQQGHQVGIAFLALIFAAGFMVVGYLINRIATRYRFFNKRQEKRFSH